MGVYIPNMEMPKSCVKCHWYYECYDEHCTLGRFLLRKYTTDVSEESYILDVQRHPDCPLVEIPTPHGRLIDEDRYMEETQTVIDSTLAPTIIEAEE